MPQDFLFEQALATAIDILRSLDALPGKAEPERLAKVTYAILEAMHRAEKLRQRQG